MAISEMIRALGFEAALGGENVLSADAFGVSGFTIAMRSPSNAPPAGRGFSPFHSARGRGCPHLCELRRCPIVARGAGTGLAGGCSPLAGGVVLMLTRMNPHSGNSYSRRSAGWSNRACSISPTHTGKFGGNRISIRAAIRSSQGTSTIGGNVATNAGGPHTLKYGVTTNHIAGLEMVLADGSIVEAGPTEHLATLGSCAGGSFAEVKARWQSLPRFGRD